MCAPNSAEWFRYHHGMSHADSLRAEREAQEKERLAQEEARRRSAGTVAAPVAEPVSRVDVPAAEPAPGPVTKIEPVTPEKPVATPSAVRVAVNPLPDHEVHVRLDVSVIPVSD